MMMVSNSMLKIFVVRQDSLSVFSPRKDVNISFPANTPSGNTSR